MPTHEQVKAVTNVDLKHVPDLTEDHYSWFMAEFEGFTRRNELESQFRFVEKFIDAALNDGPSVKEILAEDPFRFPPFIWNVNEYLGWVQTKYPKERGEKKREFHDAA